MKTRVIVNPSAGANRGAERASGLEHRLTRLWPDLEWTESQSAAHLTDLARGAALAHYDRVVVAGGDGSVHAAASALVGTETVLSILPVGTGNDVATSVGVPGDLDQAFAILQQDHVRAIDVGRANDRIFCCVLGVGMDTPALRTINASRLRRGRLLYGWAALKTALSYRPQTVRIRWPGVEIARDVMQVTIANTPTYAGGMKIAPLAEVDDGLLDLAVYPRLSWAKMLGNLRAALGGGDEDSVVRAQYPWFELTSDEPLPVTLDGELTDLTTPLRVEVVPAALRVVGAPLRAERPVACAAA